MESRIASGSIGIAEATRLGQLFRLARLEKSPVVLYLDSAGARVSEGLKALGAFRAMYRDALAAALGGAPLFAVIGRNCFGGASMLAHLARVRVLHPSAQLAMSGPSILASAAGASALDETFRAMAEAALGSAARRKAGPRKCHLGRQLRPREERNARCQCRAGHEGLDGRNLRGTRSRLAKRSTAGHPRVSRARTSASAFPRDSRSATWAVLSGRGEVGWRGHRPSGNPRRAAVGWRTRAAPGRARLEARSRATLRARVILLDCESHLANLDEERAVLSEYLATLSLALGVLRATGTALETLVLGRSGGGVYVALASPADKVSVAHGIEIQVLPGAAIASILGESREAAPEIDDYRAAGLPTKNSSSAWCPKAPCRNAHERQPLRAVRRTLFALPRRPGYRDRHGPALQLLGTGGACSTLCEPACRPRARSGRSRRSAGREVAAGPVPLPCLPARRARLPAA